MYKRSYSLSLTFLIGLTLCVVHAQHVSEYGKAVKGSNEVIDKLRTTPNSTAAKRRIGKEGIRKMAERFELPRLLGRNLPAVMIYWDNKEPTEARLQTEFFLLGLFLETARKRGVDIGEKGLYSAPPEVLSSYQKKKGELIKSPLVKVPNLNNLSRAEAENILIESGLVPEIKIRHNMETDPGRVIPGSQKPEPELNVKRGEVVTFDVAVHLLAFSELKSNGTLRCSRGPDGIYHFEIEGKASDSLTGKKLLLWLRPRNPPSEIPGWYLQRPPVNGIGDVRSDGSWSGTGQVGNAQYPPKMGNTVDVGVTLVDDEIAARLLAEPGVVIRTDLPGTAITALALRVEL